MENPTHMENKDGVDILYKDSCFNDRRLHQRGLTWSPQAYGFGRAPPYRINKELRQ